MHKTHPQTTAPEVVEKLLVLSLANPTCGCNWLHDRLLVESSRPGERLSQETFYVGNLKGIDKLRPECLNRHTLIGGQEAQHLLEA